MSRNTLHLRRLLSVLGALLLLALVALCGTQVARVVPFVRAELMRLRLPTSNVAPPACAHETAHTSPPALHDSLFAAVSSGVWASNSGFLQRGVPIIDANDALCIVRSSDGALVGHYTLAYGFAELAQADGVLYSAQQQAEGDKVVQVVQVCAMRAQDGSQLWCQTSAPTVLPLVLGGGILYVQGDTTLTALRASDGA